MKIVIPSGIEIGHAENDYTGVTVFLSKAGCVAGVDVRGGAPGTRETDLLAPQKAMDRVNAVVLSGGSAYGLAASCGVMEYLREAGAGFKVGKKVVPIVTQAVLFDLNDFEYHYPDAAMGRAACLNTGCDLPFGQKGAGKGATVGKARGVKYSTKSGVGAATVKCAGITVTAVIAVNAMGDVVDPKTGEIIAGAKGGDGKFIDTNTCFLENKFLKLISGANTTIGCILTNARIDKLGANKLASIAHNGLARTIRPVHTDYDGDTLFVMTTGKIPVVNFAILQAAAVEAVERAVVDAVKGASGYTVECEEE